MDLNVPTLILLSKIDMFDNVLQHKTLSNIYLIIVDEHSISRSCKSLIDLSIEHKLCTVHTEGMKRLRVLHFLILGFRKR